MVIVIINLGLLVPKIINHWPTVRANLRGDVRFTNGQDLNDLLSAFDWLKAKREKKAIADEAVVVCRKPQFCYYYTGLRSINFPFTAKSDSVFLAITKADLILTDNVRGTSSYLNRVLMDSTKYFREVYTSGGKIPTIAILVVKKDELAKLLEKRP